MLSVSGALKGPVTVAATAVVVLGVPGAEEKPARGVVTVAVAARSVAPVAASSRGVVAAASAIVGVVTATAAVARPSAAPAVGLLRLQR